MSSIQYITLEGERWDNIAYKAYGDPGLVAPIVSANPNVPITDRLAAGTILDIPVFEELDPAEDINNLPPWKQV